MSSHSRARMLLVASALLALAGAARAEEAAETIRVILDQAKLVKLPAGAETIVIGNPAIADISVQKRGVVVITGRSPGRTNVIAIDSGGTIISETMVQVAARSVGQVVVQRGLDRASYDCAPNCLPTVALGDDEKHFNRTIDQTGQRDGMARQTGGAGGGEKKK